MKPLKQDPKAARPSKARQLPQLPPEAAQTAEERDRRVIVAAVEFSASIKRGLRYRTEWTRTMAEAGAQALLLEREPQNEGKQAIVYAVDARGYQALVQRTEWIAAVEARLKELGLPPD